MQNALPFSNYWVYIKPRVCPQGNVLRAAALAGDTAAAGALCALVRDNPPGGNSTLDPDWRGAAYIAAVVQPPGCNLKDEGASRGARTSCCSAPPKQQGLCAGPCYHMVLSYQRVDLESFVCG